MAKYHNESVTWRDTYHYAFDLIDNNIFEKEDLLNKLERFPSNNPNQIYEWLAEQAINAHNQKLDEDDIATDVFYNNKPVLFFDDIYDDYKESENKKYKVLGSSIVALASVATIAHTALDQNIGPEDIPVYIINLNLIIAGIAVALKRQK